MPRDPNEAPPREREIGGEEALIAEYWAPLAADFPGALGLKDDCAVIATPAGAELIVTTDALIAGVHVLPGEDPCAIAWKALAVNISDLVAKGATPLAYLMSVALPDAPERAWLASFAAGLAAAQQAFGCRLAGGDTDRTPGPLSVSITAFGTVPKGRMVLRTTAQPGDRVYVTGCIGDAALGLALRRDPELRARCKLDAAARRDLDAHFSRPHPPVALVPALGACASAAMDISDGLMKDFDRLCRASGVGGHIEAPHVPLSEPARAIIAAGGATLADLMSGGEDYEVLACVPPARAGEFERLADKAGTRVTCIGTIAAAAAGVVATDRAGQAVVFGKAGWDHFSRS
ncbi:MAG: thiamine-phosphate kinase [Hyphomicrobium sp.]|uniref:thiamine-phosphate kinase n=1 Tax=Hyphomicrobium sp. TaxID=82 RepID=UPI00132612DD|nr:thiamine-phosphate kinase [Hyphomicrobium sp.]KAB2941229.1 MAG: thiamine-phosphate kinase [Hyphomicrobium sp.]MBZ0209998.1 thiamine-phosphate kinase [Hyphomicrobium sp.]